MKLVNLTPHTITLVGDNGTTTIEPSGPPARVTFAPDQQTSTVEVNGLDVPIVRTATTGVVTGLPAALPDTLYIVSRQVVDAVPDRDDLVCTHDAVRDQQTRAIVGCRKLARPF